MNVQETLKRYVLAETKTAYSRRTVALTQAAVDALAEHWQKQQGDKERMGDKYDDSLHLVFPNGSGGIMIPHNITNRGHSPKARLLYENAASTSVLPPLGYQLATGVF